MRKKIYSSLEELQKDLNQWLHQYNQFRPHSGRYCYGKTPIQTFNESKHIALEKNYGKLLPILADSQNPAAKDHVVR